MKTGTCKICKVEDRVLDGKDECVACAAIDWTRLEPGPQIDRHGKVILSDQSLQAISDMFVSESGITSANTLRESLKNSFITCNSGKEYFVKIEFKTLQEAQLAHRNLLLLENRS